MNNPDLSLVATNDLVAELERRTAAHFIVLLGGVEATRHVGKNPRDAAECYTSEGTGSAKDLDEAIVQCRVQWHENLRALGLDLDLDHDET